MNPPRSPSLFKAKLLKPAKQAKPAKPAKPGNEDSWTFLVLPKSVSEKLPRRGRTSVKGRINGHPFQSTLEPDGQLSHWLKVDSALREAAGVEAGGVVEVELAPVELEPEPTLPPDLLKALAASPEARATWEATTTIARLDWIHWLESAKQAKTRASRVASACDRLASGNKRVCCFDPSGFYSKSLSAPKADED